MRLRASVALAPLLAASVACRPGVLVVPRRGEDAAARDEARETYHRACAPCHGADGRGHGPEAGSLRVPPTDLSRLAATHGGTFPRQEFIDVVSGEREVPSHGTREMPVWSQRFGPDETGSSGAAVAAALYARRRLEFIADFVESLQRKGTAAQAR